MYHSVVKVKKNLGPEFFKIKLQSLICNIANTSYAHAVLLCCLQAITSVYTSKNVAGCKKVRGQSEAALQIGMCDQKL